MAGGTGGHIFPGLAVAEACARAAGACTGWARPAAWRRAGAAARLRLRAGRLGGVRGKGVITLACCRCACCAPSGRASVVRRVKPDVLVGLGGYITFPGGMMGVALGKPLVLHEQNSVAGMANKVLAGMADRVFTAFPGVLPKARQWVGNPLRAAFTQPEPGQRFAGRSGPLRVLVVGGSLGAQALNDVVPQALALMPAAQRPQVVHQSGAKADRRAARQLPGRRRAGRAAPFIDDMASAYADADLVICRAGASTVTEIAAIGAAALFVPFPHAVDDHQTTNAKFLVDQGAAGWCSSAT
jgi:UDP-N-acetylglucosamine--N-acetylmuramyl-(pentapeptide) pyrophosphoryl-undecaprenol N-acetylglucosamine transferase